MSIHLHRRGLLIPEAEVVGGLTLVQQASAQSTASNPGTIIMPVDVQAGDFALLLDKASSKGTPGTVVPSGFTSIVNTTTNIARQIASYRILDGSEADEVLTGMSVSAGFVDKVLVTFRGSEPITSVTPSTPNAEGTDGNPAAQSVLAAGGTPPLIVFGCYGALDDATIDPRTFNPAKDGELNSGENDLWLAWRIYNTAPANTTIDEDDEGDANILQSFFVECAAAA